MYGNYTCNWSSFPHFRLVSPHRDQRIQRIYGRLWLNNKLLTCNGTVLSLPKHNLSKHKYILKIWNVCQFIIFFLVLFFPQLRIYCRLKPLNSHQSDTVLLILSNNELRRDFESFILSTVLLHFIKTDPQVLWYRWHTRKCKLFLLSLRKRKLLGLLTNPIT